MKPAKNKKTRGAARRAPARESLSAEAAQLSYDSLAAAAGALGIPKGVLQSARNQGAPGFRGSRVYVLELMPWLITKKGAIASDKKRSLEIERLQQKLDDERFESQRRRAEWIRKAEVEAFILDTAERIKAILRNKLKNELPPKIEGLRAPEIAAKMDPMIQEICRLLRYCHGPDSE